MGSEVVVAEYFCQVFGSLDVTAECIKNAFYDYINIRPQTPNEYYRRWMREHGKEMERSILYTAKRSKGSVSIQRLDKCPILTTFYILTISN